MQVNRNGNAQMKALAIAFAGAIVVAVAAMFMPISWLETLTGSTGISEIFPSTAAPLGDTARALLAFAAGVLALAALAYALLRRANGNAVAKVRTPAVVREELAVEKPAVVQTAPTVNVTGDSSEQPQAEGESLFTKIRAKIESLLKRDGDGVKDLADLPKLRSGDAHPDAPPRRPISAHRDFGPIFPEIDEVALPQGKVPFVAPVAIAEPLAEIAVENPVVEVAPESPLVAEQPEFAPYESADADAPLEDVVSHLEQALARRQSQLDQLQGIAARMTQSAPFVDPSPEPSTQSFMTAVAPVTAPVTAIADIDIPQRRLEAVAKPQQPIIRPRNGDEALRSALDTLHRMNARSH